jgi:hypothetical protein
MPKYAAAVVAKGNQRTRYTKYTNSLHYIYSVLYFQNIDYTCVIIIIRPWEKDMFVKWHKADCLNY